MKLRKIGPIFTTISLIVFSLAPFNNGLLKAQDSVEKEAVHRLTEEESKLLADKATIKPQLQAMDSVLFEKQLAEEIELFPADDLYGCWPTHHVKAYSDATIPDTFRVDVSDFVMPIEGRVSSKYGMRKRRFHYGTDIKLQRGDTIVAAFDGKIRVMDYEKRGYGYYLVVRHPNGLETVYAHLSKYLVDQDQVVKAGEPIALGGNTGRSTGPHLHLEFRFLGQAIDPADIIDFENFCTHDEVYVFNKKESAKVQNKYTAKKSSTSVKYHRVKRNDTLSGIAKRYGVSVDRLCRLNGLKKTTILRIGQAVRYS